MKTLLLTQPLRSAIGILVSAGLLLVASFNAISVAAATPKSLVVMLDGVRADACRMAKTPNIDSLSNGSWVDGYHGAWTYACHTIKDAPPNSAPNHAAIATGVSAEKSQVKDNNVFADYVRKNASATYKNYMSRLKEKSDSIQTAFLYSWEPDQVLVSDGNTCDYSKLDTDAGNVRRTISILDGSYKNEDWQHFSGIDALLLYIDLPDSFGHKGGFSPPGTQHDGYLKSIEQCDTWLGEMLDAIKRRKDFDAESWQIIICSDHGGWIGSHGFRRADTYTVPLIIAGKTINQGEIGGQACTTDIPPTVLRHFGISVDELCSKGLLDGTPRGLTAPREEYRGGLLEDKLVFYLPFDENADNIVSATRNSFQVDNHGGVLVSSGGVRGGYCSLRPNEARQSGYLSVRQSGGLLLDIEQGFSVTFWARVRDKQTGDPAIFCNKDWKDGKNPGVAFFITGEGNGNIIAANIADTNKNRVDVRQLFVPPLNEWTFCALTVSPKENATIYVVSPDKKVFFASESVAGLAGDIRSPLPWMIGQDGTGKYEPQLNVDLDEFRVWNRCLSFDEINKLSR